MNKPIYILTLHNVRTGGPEACHQLSDALIEHGFDARMVYYDMGQIGALARVPHAERSKHGGLAFGLRANAIPEYERYKSNPCSGAPDDPDAIVVIPESVAHLAAFYARATVLIWWLSVDNAFGALSYYSDEARGLYGGLNLNLLRRPNVRHAWQSRYAQGFIDALGFSNAGPLSDYTVDLTEYAAPLPMSERPKLVAFATGWKVIADLDAIIAQVREIDPQIKCVKIENLSRREMAELFARARVYVDLGCFPGKDRGPREAASMGCFTLVASYGASAIDLVNWAEPRGIYWPGVIADAVQNPERTRTIRRGSFGSEREVFLREVREAFANAL